MVYKNTLRKIKDYFGINLPFWMDSRKTLFFFFLVDFIFMIIFLDNIGIDYKCDNRIGRCIFFPIIWTILSYVKGRYSYFKEFKSRLNKLYSLLISTLVVVLVTYLINKLIVIFIPNFPLIGRDSGIFIFLISFSLQSIKFIFNPLENVKYIYLAGNDEKIQSFLKNASNYILTQKIKVKNLSDYKESNTNFQNIILLENNYYEFSRIYPNLISPQNEIVIASNWCERNLQRIPSEYLTQNDFEYYNLINLSQSLYWRIKRFGDIFISLFLLIALLPILFISAFLIKLEDDGPIFYSQLRTGLYGKTFKVVKLRSMKPNSESSGPVWAKKKDPRITKIGSILRKTRIDELPQLWSVIIGDMTLIGPRPERPEIDKQLVKKIPFYNYRNTIKPGLSGWAQVNYNYGASIEDSEKKFSYEIFYLKNHSFFLDMLIFIKTLKLLFNMEGSVPK